MVLCCVWLGKMVDFETLFTFPPRESRAMRSGYGNDDQVMRVRVHSCTNGIWCLISTIKPQLSFRGYALD